MIVEYLVHSIHEEEEKKDVPREVTDEVIREYLVKWKPRFDHASKYLTFDFIVTEVIEQNKVMAAYKSGEMKPKKYYTVDETKQLLTKWTEMVVSKCVEVFVMYDVPLTTGEATKKTCEVHRRTYLLYRNARNKFREEIGYVQKE